MKTETYATAEANIHDMDSPDWPEALHGKVWQVTGLYVPPEDRRKGYGSALMARIQDKARKKGKAVLVHVKPEGDMTPEALRAWYARLGFREIQAEPLLMVRV
jgi:ribosomal protein S18 acetylase RimI-like enzyme